MKQSMLAEDPELIGSRILRMDPNLFANQSGAAIEDGDEDETDEDELDDEPVDEDGDPTGEHDHHQDDNYALGGNVARSSGL
ncbi:hypothetical protein GCM10028803_20380 [Larkinella knui]|uniref:Uncharacterized protein n=1 Tax=Larkinella knui TaxID=2025310 RepID=A0A3P1CW99_9BACT|nr:hypothetical protein [Larkinella knui]RRB17124.1 hypothetical protein EHT87_02255 [Larkinella knui]